MRNLVLDIVKLRTCVAFMGEKEQLGWWLSSFLSRSGEAFLSPVFPKTEALARVNGASKAAQLSHDEYIGTGDVYHLFRLPENLEQAISEVLISDASILDFIRSEEAALAALKTLAAGGDTNGAGPLLLEDEIDESMCALMADAYLHGFRAREQVFPYYRRDV
jgi:hypothetical protein